MKPGWRTSELTIVGMCGVAVFELGTLEAPTLAEAIVRGAACLGLAWIAGGYAASRSRSKGGGS